MLYTGKSNTMIKKHVPSQTTLENNYSESLCKLLRLVFLSKTGGEIARNQAVKPIHLALRRHNEDRKALGLEPLTLDAFNFGNKVIFKHN